MKKIKAFIMAVVLLPSTTFAITEKQVPTINTIDGTTNITTVLVNIINFFLAFAAAVATLFIILGGILYMTSAGNEDKIKKARSMLLAAVIGLIIVILALVIVNFTKATTDKIF